MADNEQLIADIMVAQQRLQRLFAYDRSDPLFNSHLTLTQLKILMLLSRHGNVSGGELAGLLGVGLAALSGMIDRLVVQDLVVRTEDLRDRRVRRIGLTRAGQRAHRRHHRRPVRRNTRTAPQPALSRGTRSTGRRGDRTWLSWSERAARETAATASGQVERPGRGQHVVA